MLKLSWIQGKRIVITGAWVDGYFFPLYWDIPPGVPIDTFLSTHSYTDGKAASVFTTVTDENTIDWGPSVPPDCWCVQETSISGTLNLDLTGSAQLKGYSYYYDYWKTDCVNLSGTRCALGTIVQRNNNGGYDTIWYADGSASSRSTNSRGYVFREYKNFKYTWEVGHYFIEYDYYFEGKFIRHKKTRANYTSASWLALTDLTEIDPSNYVDNYKRMISYVRETFRHRILPEIKTQVNEWCATLDAVQGFHPYDINLVEALFQFSMEDVVPIGTSDKVLSILETAVSSRGGLTSPKGITFAAQIFANSYLYYKYVALGDFSDISEIVVGTDKPALCEIVRSLYQADPGYVPSTENEKLKALAQRIVYRDKRLLSSYGTYSSEPLITVLGEGTCLERARLKAYPSYYADMSTAEIITEEIGLSLSLERLSATVPYEFIAQWFLPIEETIRSLENNSDVLSMKYEVENLCLSQKVRIGLDMDFLRAEFGLSDATGSLILKDYRRHSQRDFPPTTPDLSLHPRFTLSRVMQGTSLLITKFS